MIYAILLFIAFSFVSYRLIGSFESKSKVLISSFFSLLFSSAVYYMFHLKRVPEQKHFIQFDHYTFLYFITLVIVSMGFALILEMMTDGSPGPREQVGNPVKQLKLMVKKNIRYAQLLRYVAKSGLFKSPLQMNRESRNRQMGEALKNTLEEAGGVFIKFGQFLSTRTDLFAPEFIEELTHLQEDVQRLPGEQVRLIVEEQLGCSIEEAFASFNEQPLAAASIAQVHRATLKSGEAVVVKVLRPELKEQMAVDVAILSSFATMLENRMSWASNVGITSIADGFIQNLYEETDLSIEQSNIQQMRNGMTEHVYIPKVYPAYSTSEMVVVEFLDGVSLGKVSTLSKNERVEVAKLIFDDMLAQIFERGVFHNDPHPGNIFILHDGRPAFLDFGAIGKLSEFQQRGFIWLLFGILRRNPETMAIGVERLVVNSEEIDFKKLELALGEFLIVHSFEGDILEEMGTDLFDIMGNFGLQFHPSVAAAFRSMITLQGSLQEIDPDFNLERAMQRFLKTQLTVSKAKEVIEETVEDELLNTLPRLKTFPRRIDTLLRQAEQGDFTINMGIFSHKENRDYVNQTVSLLFLSIVGISFGLLSLGALFLAQNETTEGYSFLDVFGYSGLGLSVIMLIRVAIQSIHRTK